MKITETIFDITTQELTVIERDATQDEIDEREEAKLQQDRLLQEKTAKDAARQAVLDKLGLSADEVAALLG